jgi:hypothetical protein
MAQEHTVMLGNNHGENETSNMEGITEINTTIGPRERWDNAQDYVVFSWLVSQIWGKGSDANRARNSQWEMHEVNGQTFEVDRKFLPLVTYKPEKI